MTPFKCERCGKDIGNRYDCFYLGVSHQFERIEDYRLCENCYQTIKEVLENGEVK